MIGMGLNKVERAIQFLSLLLDRVCRVFWQFSGAVIVLMALVITYNVLKRYIFRQQDPYAYVISCIIMLVCVVFAIAYTQRQGQHLRVDLLDRYLPERVKGIMLNIIGPLIGLICISILVWKSWGPAWFALQSSDTYGSGAVRLPTWPSRMTVTLGAGLLCLVLIAQILRHLVSLRGKALEGKK
jgi:TRAP-type mannitol/chloroaromatic compound transport system permease small subunit